MVHFYHWFEDISCDENKNKGILRANAMKRIAAERSSPDSLTFERAERPDDRVDYCLGCSFFPQSEHQSLVFTIERTGARSVGEQWGLGPISIPSELDHLAVQINFLSEWKTSWSERGSDSGSLGLGLNPGSLGLGSNPGSLGLGSDPGSLDLGSVPESLGLGSDPEVKRSDVASHWRATEAGGHNTSCLWANDSRWYLLQISFFCLYNLFSISIMIYFHNQFRSHFFTFYIASENVLSVNKRILASIGNSGRGKIQLTTLVERHQATLKKEAAGNIWTN